MQRRSGGKLFQQVGPATLNAFWPYTFVILGTCKSDAFDDLNVIKPCHTIKLYWMIFFEEQNCQNLTTSLKHCIKNDLDNDDTLFWKT